VADARIGIVIVDEKAIIHKSKSARIFLRIMET